MPIWRRIASFLRLGSYDQLMVCEAIAMLALARFVVITTPFRFIAA
jgi:hypothetical protein